MLFTKQKGSIVSEKPRYPQSNHKTDQAHPNQSIGETIKQRFRVSPVLGHGRVLELLTYITVPIGGGVNNANQIRYTKPLTSTTSAGLRSNRSLLSPRQKATTAYQHFGTRLPVRFCRISASLTTALCPSSSPFHQSKSAASPGSGRPN
jgi:hypothetical protein